MTPVELLVCCLLIALSAFVSASEIALFSLSRFQLRTLKDRARASHRQIKRLLSDPGGLLITTLVTNEILNISLSALITGSVSPDHGMGVDHWARSTLLGILITAPIVLFLCEITPKIIAARGNYLVAPLTVRPLSYLYAFFRPVRALLKRLINLTGGTIRETDNALLLRESDFLTLVEEGHKEGAIQESELELIKNVFALDDLQAEDIATPLSRLQTVTEHTTLKTALSLIRSLPYSRIPVLSMNRKRVVGILYTKDLLRAKLDPDLVNLTVTAVMRKPLYANPTLKLNNLFRKMKQQRMHMVILQTSTGDTTGIVTMSDLLDTLFEDVLPIDDSFESAPPIPSNLVAITSPNKRGDAK